MTAQQQKIQAGEVLEGRYRIVSEGVRQDLGTLHQAHDIWHDRWVSVLILKRRFGGGTLLLDRLARANQAVSDLHQPALAAFEQIGAIEGQAYLIRRRVEGRSLAEMLNDTGSLRVDVAVEIAIHLCDALATLHRAGLAHGGLSPHSVIVNINNQNPSDPGPAVTLIDAGLVPALRPVPAPPDEPWGRFPYLCPEQAAGKDVHPASDVYVVGSLLYEMLAGRPPFRTDDRAILAMQHRNQEPPSLRILMPLLPSQLDQIVHKAMSKEPSARYRNAGQLGHILRSQIELPQAARIPEAATPRRAPERGRLLVPPPPAAQAAPQAYAARPSADHGPEEPAGTDWILVGLIIAALIAVLGLIPLWRAVHRRYTVSPAILERGVFPVHNEMALHWPSPLVEGQGLVEGNTELDDSPLLWYNSTTPKTCGVKRATNQPVWESSLRVLNTSCIRLVAHSSLEA